MHPEAARAVDNLSESESAWVEHGYNALSYICGMRGKGARVTADAVWALLAKRGIAPPKEPKAMAAVMQRAQRDGLVEPTNETKPSERDENHSRPVRIWRVLKP